MSKDNRYDADGVQADPRTEGKQWQNLEALIASEDFQQQLLTQFPREAAVLKRSGMSRRNFMQLMGASLAAGGLGLTGCTPAQREEEILPFANMPERLVPGKPLFYASSMVLGGYATGVLIETHEGRPTRIDGNPNHPASLGGSGVMQLASILELYNPERSIEVHQGEQVSSWAALEAELTGLITRLAAGRGAGLRVLTESITSPTVARLLADLLTKYPQAKWYQYEPLARDNVLEGARLAFGEVVETVYQFAGAQVVLSLDADFMGALPGSLRYARDFTAGRKVRADNTTMNRLYAVEAAPAITGAVADHRLSLRPGQVESLALALAAAVGVAGIEAPAEADFDTLWLNAVVEDLQANQGASIVIAGDEQSPVVHALVHAINAALGNVGQTVIYLPSLLAQPVNAVQQLNELVAELTAGDVSTLFILGGNPVYNAPADSGFAEALARAGISVHLSPYVDETSQLTTWHIPQTHFTEAWGDARAFDGTASVIQPPINPLYPAARSDVEVLALLEEDRRSAYEIVQSTWQTQYTGDDFAAYWRRALHDGLLADSAPAPITPVLNSDLATLLSTLIAAPAQGLEIAFRPHPSIGDGRFAFNSWLQELPHPLTRIAWDNVLMISAATARRLNLANGNLVTITLGGRSTQAPVWVTAGQPDEAVTLALGYGRGIGGDVIAGLSFNAYALRTAGALWQSGGVELQRTGRQHAIANTQKVFQTMGTDPVRYGSLEQFINQPDFVQNKDKKKIKSTFLSQYDYAGYAWGMTIDLTSCIGCNACIIGCQSENNIPTIGKAEVLQERDMHWLRVDRYNVTDSAGTERTHFQPVPCMQCENAPCEYECPVQATVHDHEGLNNMVYNRCIGTRACSANCPYGVRRFNFKDYVESDLILIEQRNPDVSVRERGVMEKCTFCVQRISEARINSTNENRRIFDGEVMPACAAACPTQAIKFGNINDASAVVAVEKAQPHNYGVLEELNTLPRTTYLARLFNPAAALSAGTEADEEG
ncbi:MAG: TAT-variant-translocated molybdopterin oxidoreductase [Anaerolineae bacterium]|nr:TAT-variant-translocated molybdopterin oxidoreductase [Anaerolineae bacterium]